MAENLPFSQRTGTINTTRRGLDVAQSPEYPDLKWVPPRSWDNTNRTSVQLIVIHDTEGSENANSAEDGAAYDTRRTDGTSAHYYHDQNSTVQCVRTEDQSHTARTQGNRRGIHHELCGVASQGAAGWADPASEGTLRQAAKQVARDARKWNIPIRHLTSAQVRDGARGICGHVNITEAFPADNGTHTDPGKSFPWAHFIDLVKQAYGGVDVVADGAWIIKEGDEGELVGMWQQKLVRLGVDIGDLDNVYGPKMAAGIQKYRVKLAPTAKAYKYLTGWTAFRIDQDIAKLTAVEAIKDALKSIPTGSPVNLTELVGTIEGGSLRIKLAPPA